MESRPIGDMRDMGGSDFDEEGALFLERVGAGSGSHTTNTCNNRSTVLKP
jgi:hypothetical protein